MFNSGDGSVKREKGKQSHYRPEVPRGFQEVNPLNAELNPICHLLALLGAHHIFHVSGLRVKVPRLRDNGPGWCLGCQPYAPAAFYLQEILLVLISVNG